MPTERSVPRSGARLRLPTGMGLGLSAIVAVIAVVLLLQALAVVSAIVRLVQVVAVAAVAGWVGWKLGVTHGRQSRR